jgi:hypothetical protein
MPDITMCKGEGCTKKEQCYRHTAKPNKQYQSYFIESPIREVKQDDDTSVLKCDYFWDTTKKKDA